MRIIAISGKKRTGKDTIAAILAASCNGSVVRVGFATALKREVCQTFRITEDFLEQNKDNFRLLLQSWGTEVRRELYGQDYWIKKMEAYLRGIQTFGNPSIVLITDLRFKNELAYLKSIGATTVRVTRPTAPSDSHRSENELDNEQFDIVINNDGSIEELINKVQTKIPL